MGIFFNDVNACIPCSRSVPAPENKCIETPPIRSNDPYIYNWCNGAHRYNYICNPRIYERYTNSCGRRTSGFKAAFEFIGNTYYLSVKHNEVTITTYSGCIAFPCLNNIYLDIGDLKDINIRSTSGYVDRYGCAGEKETARFFFTEDGYWRDIHYEVRICLNAISRRITVSLLKNGSTVYQVYNLY